jgi:hypothetical protein
MRAFSADTIGSPWSPRLAGSVAIKGSTGNALPELCGRDPAGAITLDLDQMVNRNKGQFCAFESAARHAGAGRYKVT